MDPFRRASFWLGLRGGLSLMFGLLCNLWPGAALGAIVFAFAFYAIVDGLLLFGAAYERSQTNESWALVAAEGGLGLAVGAVILAAPDRGMSDLWLAIAIWAIVTGTLPLVGAFFSPVPVAGVMAATLGTVSAFLGIAMLGWPTATARGLSFLVGGYAIVFGALLVALAIQLRRMAPPSQWA